MFKAKWRYGILVAIISIFFGLYPQMAVWSERGENWNGVFASNDLDEVAYAAYLQALIDGRARKNDPYSGRDDSTENPQPESIFSIQFLPAYVLAIPARIFGASASQMFILTSAVAIFFTALMLFWLIALVTEDDIFAAVGTLIVICGGALVAGLGAINEFTGQGVAYPYLPFMRRYIPALAFPFFIGLFAAVWIILCGEARRAKIVYSFVAGLCFAFLVFSYFYLWTSAAAFLFLITLSWIVLRPENWKQNLKYLLIIDAVALLALLPYAYLLSQRAESTDAVQLLVNSRMPDLLRATEIVCFICLALIAFGIWQKMIELSRNRTIFLISFALIPLAVFNQQIITGRSLQPFHYEYYVVNYATALVVVFTLFIFISKIKTQNFYRIILTLLTVLTIGWGYIEVKFTTDFLMFWNVARDEAMPVAARLAEIARKEEGYGKDSVTVNFDYVQADSQPVVAPQAVLWARHQHVFAGVGWEENKERFYQLLYYADRDAAWLREDLRRGDIEALMALFGWDRFNPTLSVNYRPITAREIAAEVQRYEDYAKNFSLEQAKRPVIKFAVAKRNAIPAFENLDRWYERDAGEIYGEYILYRLKLKE